MAFMMKPSRPNGMNGANPRTHRAPGFEAMLKELASNNTNVKRVSKDAIPNTARTVEKKQHYIQPLKTPLSARGVSDSKPSSNNPSPSALSAPEPPKASFISPTEALEKHGKSLSSFEKDEILGYKEVYYCGEGARKNMSGRGANHGYDDDKGDYKVVTDDHMGYRYQVVGELGRGSFGQVSKALDHKNKKFVALKIIKNKKKFHDQALIEVNILKHLRDKDPNEKMHIVKMLNHFIFRNHMVIIFDLHGMNLYELCKANRFAPLSMPSIKHFAKQLLMSLHFCYKEKIVHCDLKPENILLKRDSKSQVKLIDFGSSCFESQKLYTYIQSRFYRAPEIILGIPYTTAIDMWSFGCILAELANGYPLFPGESENEQLACQMEFLGVPTKTLIDRSPRKRNFFDSNGTPRLTPNSRGRVRRPNTKDLSNFLRSATKSEGGDEFIDFVSQCLTWNPEKRWTASTAMKHPWICGEFEASSAVGSAAATSVAASVPHPPSTVRKNDKFALPMLSARR